MKSRVLGIGVAIAASALSAFPLIASAAQGDWLLRGGVGYVAPKDGNLENVIENGIDLNVDDGLSATVEGTYMFRDHWGVELLAAWPFSHEVKIDELGKVATIEHLPPTLSLQYHFRPEAAVRPYVGLGLNYTNFNVKRETGVLRSDRLDLDDSWGAAAQVGVDFETRYNWFANIAVRYIDIESDASVNGADLGTVEVDPFIYQVQIGYRFRKEAPVAAAPPPPPAPAPAPAKPVDTDGDGVIDPDDQCPDTPRGDVVGVHGCSCNVTRQVQFAFDSAELTDAGRATLDEAAERLKELRFISGTVTGHTDSKGSDEYNQNLSERRAATVARYLEGKGIGQMRFDVEGAGETQPVADNATEEGRAMNRRVVISRTDCATK